MIPVDFICESSARASARDLSVQFQESKNQFFTHRHYRDFVIFLFMSLSSSPFKSNLLSNDPYWHKLIRNACWSMISQNFWCLNTYLHTRTVE